MRYTFDFGPGVGRPDPGVLFLYGSRASGAPGRRLFVDAFYLSTRASADNLGSPCPLPGDELLRPDELYPFTLYEVGGTKDELIYACTLSLVIGIVDLRFVANESPVSCFPNRPGEIECFLSHDFIVTVLKFYRRQEVDCLGGGRGYQTLASLNEDISFERTRVLAGGSPEPAYFFTFCPNIPLDASVPLRPDLDNIFISCGQSSNPVNTCSLVGGTTQVEVETHAGSAFPVFSITLSDLTFTGFSYAAVASGTSAIDLTTVFLRNAIFTVSRDANLVFWDLK